MPKVYESIKNHLNEVFDKEIKKELVDLIMEEINKSQENFSTASTRTMISLQMGQVEEAFEEINLEILEELNNRIDDDKSKRKRFAVVYREGVNTLAEIVIVDASDWWKAMRLVRPARSKYSPTNCPKYTLGEYKKYMMDQFDVLVDVRELPST